MTVGSDLQPVQVRHLGRETGCETRCSGEAGARRAGASPMKRLKAVIATVMSAAPRAGGVHLASEICGRQT